MKSWSLYLWIPFFFVFTISCSLNFLIQLYLTTYIYFTFWCLPYPNHGNNPRLWFKVATNFHQISVSFALFTLEMSVINYSKYYCFEIVVYILKKKFSNSWQIVQHGKISAIVCVNLLLESAFFHQKWTEINIQKCQKLGCN